MKNLWVQTENPFVTWLGDLTAIASHPEAILEVVQATLTSGARHRIFDVTEASEVGYTRGQDSKLADVLGQLLKHDRVLDVFRFTGAAMLPGISGSSTVETTLCYYDREDRLTESVVTDLGALLSSLEPVPDSIPNGMMRHYPPVRITGRRYMNVREGEPVNHGAYPLPVAFRLCIHSDIWFPWIFGSAHPECDHRRMFDNRELANRHTPRLNAFLGEVAAAVQQAGGTFMLRPDESARQASDWVNDQSVRLDWIPPRGIMPPEMLNVEWASLV